MRLSSRRAVHAVRPHPPQPQPSAAAHVRPARASRRALLRSAMRSTARPPTYVVESERGEVMRLARMFEAVSAADHDGTDERTLEVGLGARSYPIHIGARHARARRRRSSPARAPRRAIVVTNDDRRRALARAVAASLAASGVRSDVVTIPDGEAHKNFATLQDGAHAPPRTARRAQDDDRRARAAASSATSPASPRRSTSAACPSSRFRRRCSRRSTRPSAARPASIIRSART